MTTTTVDPTTADVGPDITNYRMVHRAIRAGAHRLADAAATMDPADRRRALAVAQWGEGYLGELHAHHTIEDDFFFPALVRKVDEAGDLIARTDADHAEMTDLMARLEPQFALLAKREADLHVPGGLAQTLARLAMLMDDHLDFEDAEILPLFASRFSVHEYEALDQQALKSLGLGKQAMFTVPFIVAAASAEEHAEMLAGAPVPMRVLHRLAKRGYERRTALAFPSVDRTLVAA
ncbi:MAG TPA: hemerythrin domain-containing protein [Aquihabitans sp.]|jgi:iron-sulfur cluster repair protein YtfE (RIC family)|nr:hemerythrin domain-containing protein [Aquihabitans sp.]